MNKGIMTRVCAVLMIVAGTCAGAFAQNAMSKEQKEAYEQVIKKRADKIADALGITDSSKYKKVSKTIAEQYEELNEIYTDRDAETKSIKEKNAGNKDEAKNQLAELQEKVNKKVDKQHQKYLSKLNKELTPEQVEKVKDGMTYNVKNVTYNAYMQMLPNLTGQQKEQIKAWLIEAREHAMDAESSEKKHAWFGKYKGRINNYLSKSGIDMKKAEADWQQRIKENQKQKTNG